MEETKILQIILHIYNAIITVKIKKTNRGLYYFLPLLKTLGVVLYWKSIVFNMRQVTKHFGIHFLVENQSCDIMGFMVYTS